MKTRQFSILVIILLMAMPLAVMGQYRSESPEMPELGLKLNNGSQVLSLLDPSRWSFQNSYSMQVFSSGNSMVSTGLLQSSFEYFINPQVTVRGHVGLLHDPFAGIGPVNQQTSVLRSLDRNNLILGGEISYRPTDNMLFQFSFSQMPQTAYGYQYARPYPYRGYR